jgi:hypothetical protein
MYLNGKSYRAFKIGESRAMLLNQRAGADAEYEAGYASSGALMMEVKEIT